MRLSLRARILLSSSALLVALTAATLAYVSVQANRFVSQRLDEDLRRAQELIRGAEAERLARLELAAQVVASFPALKALFEADAATMRDFLLEYQQRNRFAELLMVLDPGGRVLARTDSVAPVPIPDAVRWLPSAAGSAPSTPSAPPLAAPVLVAGARVYHGAVAAVEAGGHLFGYLLAGAPIEQDYARRLRDISRDEILLLGDKQLLGSTLLADRLPWRTREAWLAAFGPSPGPHAVTVAGERYVALASHAGGGAPLSVVSLQSSDRAIAPYRRIQIGLVLLGLVAALLGIGGSALLARGITAPVARLSEGTRQVAAGNFDFHIDERRQDELGALAQSFNQMTRGLRERADMQKFVSQSTVQMIQANTARATSAGERREMTMFFSDVRGFTALSEHRPPEEVVAMLNRCLRLQADLVRRFSGDVDKYIGDAVFAHFAGEDMVLNAIRCAVAMHRALDAAAAAAGPDEPRLELGIGIVFGEAILGSIGSEDRLDYTAIGSNVNLCSRLCGLANAREVLMNGAAYTRVRDLVAAEPTEPLQIKGFSEPVQAWRMIVRPD